MTLQQQACVARAVAGDKDALGELLEEFGPGVERTLVIGPTWRGLLDSADVMQITYLEAFQQIARFDPNRPAAFAGWLRRMAENNLRDAIRGLEARKHPSPRMQLGGDDARAALFASLTAGVGTPSGAIRRDEAAARLRAALRLLPADYARVVELYDLDGGAIDDVAATLSRSVGAVYMLRSRAHERLRELLGGAGHEFDSRT